MAHGMDIARDVVAVLFVRTYAKHDVSTADNVPGLEHADARPFAPRRAEQEFVEPFYQNHLRDALPVE